MSKILELHYIADSNCWEIIDWVPPSSYVCMMIWGRDDDNSLFTSGLAICTMNVFYIKMTYTQDIDVNATSGNANGNANGNMSGSSNGHTAHTSLSDLSNHGYDDNN